MTREEAINIMKVIVHMLEEKYDTDRVEDAVDMAIKALEQEPCEDAISRWAVLEIQAKYAEHMRATKFWQMRDDIKALPSVNPQEPFMNKPCVAHQVCHEDKVKVLDKIRAEIKETRKRRNVGVMECLDIIDRYKAESEGKE